MKKHEIAALSDADMKKQITESKQRIADMLFNKQIEPLQNPMMIGNLRKDIARLKTALTQKKHAEKAQETKAN
jgi:large subunit ribosomal protein L29